MVRVAALQFGTTCDVDQNLATCVRLIDQAARLVAPQLMVLPELVNHPLFHDDAEHAARMAVTLDGEFLATLAARAAQHRCHLVVNVSLAREQGKPSITSLLYGPAGELLGRADKQTLLGPELGYFARAEQAADVIETSLGRIALLSGRDVASMECARTFALRGAQILCHSSASFAHDDASLHVPARAAENRVFVVSANQLGPVCARQHFDCLTGDASEPLSAVGESQIVAPDGRSLARAEAGQRECVLVAEIDVAQAEQKLRPDGTHYFAARRPELYRALSARPRPTQYDACADSVAVAALCELDTSSVQAALSHAAAMVRELALDGVDVIVLPELFYLPGAHVEHPAAAADLFTSVIRAIAEACAETRAHVVTSVVEQVGPELFHMGVLIGQRGIVARQPQLHVPMRHAWATPGRRFDTFRMPWGRMGIAVGDDLMVPELARVFAMSGVQLLASPAAPQEAWELSLGAPARAAENRMCLAVSARSSECGSSALFDLQREFSLTRPWAERVFDGQVNAPSVTVALSGQSSLRGELHIVASNHKQLAHDAHLLDDRAYWLCGDLTRRGLGVPKERVEEQVSEPEPSAAAESSDATPSSDSARDDEA